MVKGLLQLSRILLTPRLFAGLANPAPASAWAAPRRPIPGEVAR